MANGTRDALGGGDAAQTAGNVLANVVAGAGGFLIGGTTGAFTAGNVDLYNRSTGNGDGHGSTENSALGDVVDWAKSTYGSPVDDVRRWAGQLAGQVASNNGQALPADPNPLIDVTNNSKPPAAGGSAMPVVVCVPPVCTVAIAPTPGMPGYVPSNTTFNSGNGDQSFGGKNVSDLSDAAKVPDSSDRSGELTSAGRALQKHGGRDSSAFPTAKGNPAAINEQGQTIVDQILNDPGSTVIQRNTGRFGDVIDITAPDGRGLRYSVDGNFITALVQSLQTRLIQ